MEGEEEREEKEGGGGHDDDAEDYEREIYNEVHGVDKEVRQGGDDYDGEEEEEEEEGRTKESEVVIDEDGIKVEEFPFFLFVGNKFLLLKL